MPRKNKKDSKKRDDGERRLPRPKPVIDFTIDALDFKNTNLLRQFVTDAGDRKSVV